METISQGMDAYIQDQMGRLNLPGSALAIVEGDRIVHLRGFGKARPGGETPGPQTPFFIGSLTKSFTALGVMQLFEAGKLELDEPVRCFLPWFRVADPHASSRMTVHHLLHQTSGLPMLAGMAVLGDLDCSSEACERQARALASLKLTRPVGSRFEYSNLNYNLLGLVIEAASGERYADIIQRHIFDPLDMRHSYTSKAAAQADGLAVGYRYWLGQPLPAADLPIPAGSLASGQLISCAEDMGHYLIAHLNGGRYRDKQILSEAGIRELHRPAVEIHEMGQSLGHYGMGWISGNIREDRIVWHSGIVPDFGGFMALVPGQQKAFVWLYNANHAMLKLALDQAGMGAAHRLAGHPAPPAHPEVSLWLMRSLLAVPVLQGLEILATLRRSRLRRPPTVAARLREGLGRLPHLAAGLGLLFSLGKMRGFVRLFMPDAAWMALISGAIATAWVGLIAVLALREQRGWKRRRAGLTTKSAQVERMDWVG